MADIVSDGMTRVTWVATLASVTSPSAATIEAGTDLEGFITPDGFNESVSNDDVDSSALNSTFSTTEPGRTTVELELTFKDQGKANPPYSTFAGRTSGYLVIRRGVAVATSYAASQTVDVYTVTASDPYFQSPAANEVTKVAFKFFNTAPPSLDATTAS